MNSQSDKGTDTNQGNGGAIGRLLSIPWQESEAQLLALYQRETDPRRRDRLKALWLLRQGKSIQAACQHTEASYRAIQMWLAWYRQGGLAEVLRRLPGHNAPGSRPFLSQAQLDMLKTRAERGDFGSIAEIVDWVHNEWGITFKYKGIYTLFRRRGIVFKRG